jgi:hypothetical protein
MFRKILFVFCLLAVFGLASSGGGAIAKNKTPTFEQVFTPGFPNENPWLIGGLRQYQSSLYISVSSETSGGQIWRSFDGKTWEPVVLKDFGISPSYHMSWDMTVFQGKLYVPVNCYGAANCPGILLRSSNGQDWEQIPLDTGTYQLDKLGVYKGMIYATSVWGGGQIWRSPTGNPGTWQVVKDLEPGVGSSSSPTAYKNRLYISGYASGDSVFIWQSADGLNWETTNLKITDNPEAYIRDGRLMVFKGDLYLCVTNYADGGAIYRTRDGRNWEPVVSGDPSTSIGAYMDTIEYQGDLYAASFYYVSEENWGTKLWRSHTGNPGDWELVNADGSWGLKIYPERGAMGIFKGDLYIEDVFGSLYRMKKH